MNKTKENGLSVTGARDNNVGAYFEITSVTP
jgi:shikimate kinase